MKRYDKMFLAEIGLLAVATALSVWLSGIYWLVAVGAALILNLYLILCLERRKYEKELEQTSRWIEELISDNCTENVPVLTDMLSSKLHHQLIRLQTLMSGYREKAEKDNREIRNLIVEIAHQLRMPLANIETYLGLLKEEETTPEMRKRYIAAVETSQEQISFLIESFIKMARLETKIIQIKKESKDLKATVMNTILKTEKAARAKNIQIIFSCKHEIDVRHDQNWLGEAVFNLLDNSIKYSELNSKICVSIVQNEMFAQIAIRDYAIGIQPGEEHDIFRRFYRGKNVTDQKGFGLGLYLSREILTKHDGFIKVKREKPGLSFSVYLPMKKKIR